MDVLKQTRKSRFFERFLQIFVSGQRIQIGGRQAARPVKIYLPPNKLVKDFYVFLDIINLWRFFCVENGERRDGGVVVDVASTWLEEAADQKDFKECICIFEEFKGGSCADEFSCKRVKIAWSDCFEVFVELITED